MKTTLLKMADRILSAVEVLMSGATAVIVIAGTYVRVKLMMDKKKNDGHS